MWNFPPTPKATASATRAVPPVETERRVAALAPLVPVTRVVDLTPLDPLGLPVWSVVTPLARDLTTHLGKGADPASARVSALMEAIERTSAESVAGARLVRGNIADLRAGGGPEPIDPAGFDLPDDTVWRPDAVVDWIEGHDLVSGAPVRVPLDLATNPPREGVLRDVDTNGLASGNVLLEAVVHALCEVVERDILSQIEFRTVHGDGPPPADAVDPATLPEDAGRWAARIAAAGHDLVVQDLTGDLGVPTFRAHLVDHDFPTRAGPLAASFPGYGTHPDASVAVLRSITEAVQSRLAVIQGARDSYNEVGRDEPWPVRALRLRPLEPGRRRSFAELPTYPTRDLREDLHFLLDRLRAAGLRSAIAVDLTRADLGVPVVRVRVPGLSSFVVNRRRVGWRCLRHLL